MSNIPLCNEQEFSLVFSALNHVLQDDSSPEMDRFRYFFEYMAKNFSVQDQQAMWDKKPIHNDHSSAFSIFLHLLLCLWRHSSCVPIIHHNLPNGASVTDTLNAFNEATARKGETMRQLNVLKQQIN